MVAFYDTPGDMDVLFSSLTPGSPRGLKLMEAGYNHVVLVFRLSWRMAPKMKKKWRTKFILSFWRQAEIDKQTKNPMKRKYYLTYCTLFSMATCATQIKKEQKTKWNFISSVVHFCDFCKAPKLRKVFHFFVCWFAPKEPNTEKSTARFIEIPFSRLIFLATTCI